MDPNGNAATAIPTPYDHLQTVTLAFTPAIDAGGDPAGLVYDVDFTTDPYGTERHWTTYTTVIPPSSKVKKKKKRKEKVFAFLIDAGATPLYDKFYRSPYVRDAECGKGERNSVVVQVFLIFLYKDSFIYHLFIFFSRTQPI